MVFHETKEPAAKDHVSMSLDSLASHTDETDRYNRQGCG